jgi:5-methyltetrahydrofolate--homocysteine methyltransferase
MDGAMGTELMKVGLAPPSSAEMWNLAKPDAVCRVHAEYVSHGACCLLANTFLARATAHYSSITPEMDWARVIKAGVELARGECPPGGFVLGDVGPPMTTGRPSARDEIAGIRWQLAQLQEAGADGILLETQSSLTALGEVLVEHKPTVPLLLSFAFRMTTSGPMLADLNEGPEEAAKFAESRSDAILALGVNCGKEMSLEAICDVLRSYRRATTLPLFARPNAGTPERRGDAWHYPVTPQDIAEATCEMADAGATMLGGCCGTTPSHIAAMRDVLDKHALLWSPNP